MKELIRLAKKNDYPELVKLLQSYALPTEDIDEDLKNFFLLYDKSELVSSIGFEAFNHDALLRSLAVNDKFKSRAYGVMMTEFLIDYLRKNSFRNIFLLTNTAELFFKKFGFLTIDRNQAPQSIKATKEFSHLCPSTAVCMYLDLS